MYLREREKATERDVLTYSPNANTSWCWAKPSSLLGEAPQALEPPPAAS